MYKFCFFPAALNTFFLHLQNLEFNYPECCREFSVDVSYLGFAAWVWTCILTSFVTLSATISSASLSAPLSQLEGSFWYHTNPEALFSLEDLFSRKSSSDCSLRLHSWLWPTPVECGSNDNLINRLAVGFFFFFLIVFVYLVCSTSAVSSWCCLRN